LLIFSELSTGFDLRLRRLDAGPSVAVDDILVDAFWFEVSRAECRVVRRCQQQKVFGRLSVVRETEMGWGADGVWA
jgi:hypothetical protein